MSQFVRVDGRASRAVVVHEGAAHRVVRPRVDVAGEGAGRARVAVRLGGRARGVKLERGVRADVLDVVWGRRASGALAHGGGEGRDKANRGVSGGFCTQGYEIDQVLRMGDILYLPERE